MKIVDCEVYGPCREWQFFPVSKIGPLQPTADSKRQTLSDEIVKRADRLARGEQLQSPISLLPITLQSKILDHLGKVKRKLDRWAVPADVLHCIEFCGSRCVCGNTGRTSPVAETASAKLKVADFSGPGIDR